MDTDTLTEKELLDRSYKNAVSVFVASIGNGGLFSILFLLVHNPTHISIWFSVCVLISIWRLNLAKKYKKTVLKTKNEVKKYKYLFSTGAYLGALCWGYAGVFFYPENSEFHLVIYILSMLGIASAGAFALASNLKNVIGFLIIVTSPVTFHYLRHFDTINIGMRILVILMTVNFNLFLIVSSRIYLKSMRNAIQLRIENDRLIQHLRKEKNRVETASQAKSQFLATMSHEIRTPLNGLIGMIQILDNDELSKSQRDYLKTMDSSADSLLKILNEILDYSKIEIGKLELENVEFNWVELVNEVGNLMKSNAIQKGLDFDIQIENSDIRILSGDSMRLRQIISNLISNSIKFTEKGGVKIHARLSPVTENDYRLNLSVKDTGIGISSEALEKIFNDFSQADSSTTRKFGGTGLGLAISQKLASLMNTKIKVESQEGSGSSFQLSPKFQVPNKITKQAKKQTVTQSKNQTKQYSAKIILVDDDGVSRRVGKLLLKRFGFNCETISSGREAIEHLKNNPTDIVFMDYQMPELDGLETTQIIRSIQDKGFKQPYIIACTANAFKNDADKCIQAGMNHFIGKPIKLDEIAKALEDWNETTLQ